MLGDGLLELIHSLGVLDRCTLHLVLQHLVLFFQVRSTHALGGETQFEFVRFLFQCGHLHGGIFIGTLEAGDHFFVLVQTAPCVQLLRRQQFFRTLNLVLQFTHGLLGSLQRFLQGFFLLRVVLAFQYELALGFVKLAFKLQVLLLSKIHAALENGHLCVLL